MSKYQNNPRIYRRLRDIYIRFIGWLKEPIKGRLTHYEAILINIFLYLDKNDSSINNRINNLFSSNQFSYGYNQNCQTDSEDSEDSEKITTFLDICKKNIYEFLFGNIALTDKDYNTLFLLTSGRFSCKKNNEKINFSKYGPTISDDDAVNIRETKLRKIRREKQRKKLKKFRGIGGNRKRKTKKRLKRKKEYSI